jgi:hypothetical protein
MELHMKKILFILIVLCFLFCCGTEKAEVERIMEDGAEVVINHLEPYSIRGESSLLHLEEEFTIDPERDEIAERGLTDINSFEVDSEGSIYFFQGRGFDLDLVCKFDKEGNFLKTFGRRGQGPGEIQFPQLLCITEKDEIPIQDGNTQKLYIFDTGGALARETQMESEETFGGFKFFPLENGNYLKYGEYFDPESQHRQNILQLFSPNFEKIKELDRCDHGKVVVSTQEKKIFTPRVFIAQISCGMIHVGHEKRGYEILVYDLDGKLLKKIRKAYNPADVPAEFKENWLANIGRYEDRLVFPDKMPPFHYFFLDDQGRLYVKTYEEGPNKGEFWHDIFNPDGIFIARKSLPGYGDWIYPGDSLNRAKAKNNRFYCIREKESGFKELAVYKIIWD